ncbi:unnamed protein product [Sphagnum troendelagicum]|uniref:Uncharacterized protein n=1 Tax=Sphagnum troendelagicum TaxID=128251 RepID=A0ABP0TRI4_9BRYO
MCRLLCSRQSLQVTQRTVRPVPANSSAPSSEPGDQLSPTLDFENGCCCCCSKRREDDEPIEVLNSLTFDFLLCTYSC